MTKKHFFANLVMLLLVLPLMAQYTLTDDDVVVKGGYITSCSYDFTEKDIIIPSVLDGQSVLGIDNSTYSMQGIFYQDTLNSVVFPATMQEIGAYSFYGSSLTNIDLSQCTQLTEIGVSSFGNCDLTTLDLSGCENLVTIEDEAFRNNDLTMITIPASVTFLGDICFNNNQIETVNGESSKGLFFQRLPTGESDLTTLVSYGGVDSVINFLPEELEVIGNNVFQGTPSVVEVDFSTTPNLIEIGRFAFYNAKLEAVDLSACKKLEMIDYYAFSSNNIKNVNLTECTNLRTIGDCAFYANNISDIDLTNNSELVGLESGAFYDNNIETVDLSKCTKLAFISGRVFDENPLKSVDISGCSALSFIGSLAFSDLSPVTLPAISPEGYSTWFDEYGNTFSANQEVTDSLVYYYIPVLYTLADDDVVITNGVIESITNGLQSKFIVIPEELNDQKVIGIADGDYWTGVFTKKNLINVTLPSTIQYIGAYAFRSNIINHLNFSELSNLKEIGYYAFTGNDLKEIDFTGCSNLEKIGESSFSYTNTTDVSFNGCRTLKQIGQSAFSRNPIDSINFATCSSLTTIGVSAFSNDSLMYVDLSPCTSLEVIGASAFSSNKLVGINLTNNDKLREIGRFAFAYNNLDTIYVEENTSLILIEAYAIHRNNFGSFILPTPDIPGETFQNWLRENYYGYSSAVTDNFAGSNSSYGYVATFTEPIVAVTEDIDFGLILKGNSRTISISIRNYSNDTIHISNISTPDGFRVNELDFDILPVDEKEIDLTFEPTEEKRYNGVVEIDFNESIGQRVINVTGGYYANVVTFKDYDETVLKAEEVLLGEFATPPTVPARDGYVFVAWDTEFDNVTKDIVVTALYNVTGINTILPEDVKIYPNPTSSVLFLEFSVNNIEHVALYDFSGKKLFEDSNIEINERIDLTGFSNGVYMLQLKTDSEIYSTKIIKM